MTAPVFEQPMVVLDFETTGLSPQAGDRVTEVAALRIEGGQVVGSYVSLINCGVTIPSFITGLTGISQAMVDRAPPCSQVLPALLEFIGDDALVAHNAGFDEKFLLAESAALGLRPAYAGPICSLKLTRRVFPGLASYKLGTLARAFNLPFQSAAHRAQADAEVTVQLLHHVGQRIQSHYGIGSIAADLLLSVNRLSAAKVDGFLQKHARRG
jgi:DNA polymerase-3 subunit epsilon